MNNITTTRHTRFFVTIMVTLSLISGASAGVVVSNFGENPDAGLGVTGPVASQEGNDPDVFVASSFTTDGFDYILNSVLLNLNSSNSSDPVFVDIYSDAAGVPGTSISALSGDPLPVNPGNYTYLPAATTNLLANTTYWLVTGVNQGTGSFTWTGTTSTAQSGVWTIGDDAFSFDGTWSQTSTKTTVAYLLEIDADIAAAEAAVPEPSTYALILTGLIGLGVIRKKRNTVGGR